MASTPGNNHESQHHRKPRKSNFTQEEVDMLINTVKEHYRTLYGKYAKRATNRMTRQKAWLDILRKVNRVSHEKRTIQEVKNKWKKCQYVLKEQVAALNAKGDHDELDTMPLQQRLQADQRAQPARVKVTRSSVRRREELEGYAQKSTPPPPPQPQPQPPPQPVNEEMCLRWNSHHSNMQTAFPNILIKEQYVDVTLASEGKTLKCHRVTVANCPMLALSSFPKQAVNSNFTFQLILSSCSPYFEEILNSISPNQHPVLFMRDIPFWILKSLCDFMYAGEVHVYQDKLEELLMVAEMLKIKGLAGKSDGKKDEKKAVPPQRFKTSPAPATQSTSSQVAPSRRYNNNYDACDYDNDEMIDPLDLLEPLYEEVADDVKHFRNVNHRYTMKRNLPKKMKKRRFSDDEHEESPSPVFNFRKGTRSRPHVKIPKYYNHDCDSPTTSTTPPPTTSNEPIVTDLPSTTTNNNHHTTMVTTTDPLLDIEEIKTEPIDVEENSIVFNDEDETTPSGDGFFVETVAPPAIDEEEEDTGGGDDDNRSVGNTVDCDVENVKEKTDDEDEVEVEVQEMAAVQVSLVDGGLKDGAVTNGEESTVDKPRDGAEVVEVGTPDKNEPVACVSDSGGAGDT